MPQKRGRVLAGLLAAAALTFCAPTTASPPPQEQEHIYVPESFGQQQTEELNPALHPRSFGLPTPDNCGRRIGIMGASNTTSPSYVQYLQHLCPSTTFVVAAHGGYTPGNQLERLLPSLLEQKLDMLIVSPSGNGINRDSYIPAVREIVRQTKKQGIPVAVLTVSPRPYHRAYWRRFNTFLQKKKLNVPIDYVVDITSVLEKSRQPDECGYCKRDGIHWNDLGDQRVALKIYKKIWKK